MFDSCLGNAAMRLVMMGTGPFGIPTFRGLFDTHHTVVALVTGPLKRRGGKPAPVTPMRDIAVPGGDISGDDEEAWSAYSVQSGEDGTTWTVTIEFTAGIPINDITFWAVRDGGAEDLAIFTRPTTDPLP